MVPDSDPLQAPEARFLRGTASPDAGFSAFGSATGRLADGDRLFPLDKDGRATAQEGALATLNVHPPFAVSFRRL